MVADLAGDESRLRRHTAAAKQWFRGTKNPALVARAARLEAGLARRSGHAEPSVPVHLASDEVATVVHTTTPHTRVIALPASVPSMLLGGCRSAEERADRTASLLAQETGATAVFLYLVGASGPRLASPRHGSRPPEVVTRTLADVARDAPFELVARLRDETAGESAWLLAPLREDRAGALVGIAILTGEPHAVTEPSPDLLDQLARELDEAGDALSR